MSSQETQKENLKKEIKKLTDQIEQKRIIYKGELESAQKSDEKLEELYSDINNSIKRLEDLTKQLKNMK
jgi:hypothetical protein